MNRAKVEHDIMIKRREIERQQAELLQLQEIYENNARTQSGVLDTRNNILSNIDCNSQQQQNTFSGDATPVPQHAPTPVSQESSFSLQYLLEKQQNTMDEAVRGLRMPQRVYKFLW